MMVYTLLLLQLMSVWGDSKYMISEGREVVCRAAENCPSAAIYTGPECKCSPRVCCLSSRIAATKCVDYGDLVYMDDYGAALMARRALARHSQCAISQVPLVVGGTIANPMEFPHMVAIGFGDGDKKTFMCGGSLISDQHVLTAAHCNASRDLGPAKWAKLGALALNEQDDGETVQEVAIAERILHPRFKPPSKYDDIAIFKLAHPVTMSGHVRPACLNTIPDIDVNKVTATGWGKLTATSSNMSMNLMKVGLNVMPADICADTYSLDEGGLTLPSGVIPTQMCAGVLEGGKDTCQGDSGGPLQIVPLAPFCMYSIIAVTSFGKSCALARAPAIYTRVEPYIPWIESIVWPSK